jgi:putative ABC transport system substrate-binding protein
MALPEPRQGKVVKPQRRDFLAGFGASLIGCALAVRAQAPPPLIGFIRTSSIDSIPNLVAAFRQGLKEQGFVEGENVTIEFRSAEDHYERLPAIVNDLIRKRVAVLVANTGAAKVAKAATQTVPIVFAAGADPVKDNLVASYNRPDGNVTGVSFFNSKLGAKKLELIRYFLSGNGVVGVLENPDSRISVEERADAVGAAQTLGQPTTVLPVRTANDFDAAFARMGRERVGALLVTGDALFLSRRKELIALAARHSIPAIYSESLIVEAGGLISYGASIADAYRQVGVYAGRILKGEKPATLPVLQPTTFDLVINAKTAKALSVPIPQSLLLLANRVIQ